MRELHLKDFKNIAENVKNFTVLLEPTDEKLEEFALHIRARGTGGGTLFTERGEVRTFKSINTALRLVKEQLRINEILVLLEPRRRNDTKPSKGAD